MGAKTFCSACGGELYQVSEPNPCAEGLDELYRCSKCGQVFRHVFVLSKVVPLFEKPAANPAPEIG